MNIDRMIQQLRNDEYAVEADLIESQQARIAELEQALKEQRRKSCRHNWAYGGDKGGERHNCSCTLGEPLPVSPPGEQDK